MEKLLEIARKPTTLIGFAGIVVIMLYGIYTQVLKLPIFSELGQTYTFQFLSRVLDWAFVLAIVAVLLAGAHTLYKLYIDGKKNTSAVKLTGNVYFADDNPARGAEVWVDGVDRHKETDATGWFQIETPAWETWTVSARYANSAPVRQEIARADAARAIILHLPGNAPPPPAPPDNVPKPTAAPRPPAAALRAAYLKHLLEETRPLPLRGIELAAADPTRPELSLAAVYTALLTERPEEHALERVTRKSEREMRRLSALELLNREKYLALLGAPGSGKSTFVNFVAFCLAGEPLGDAEGNLAVLRAPLPTDDDYDDEDEKKTRPQSWEHVALLPVRVILRDFVKSGLLDSGAAVNADTLWQFIIAELGTLHREYADHLYCELLERGGLILLDGLDEVPNADDRREQVKQAVDDFVSQFPRCRFLVTCRTYAYQRADWKLRGFAEAALSPFTPPQIAHFVDSWYQHAGAARGIKLDDRQGRAAALKRQIEHNARLRELAERPLLLTLMASLHLWSGKDLPEKRQELYEEAVKLLLERWESQKWRRKADGTLAVEEPNLREWLKIDNRDVMRRELHHLAYEVHRDEPRRDDPASAPLPDVAGIPQERLIAVLMKVAQNPVTSGQLAEYLSNRTGLLEAHGGRVYAFPHRTFQEYLAACHIADYLDPGEWAEKLRADPQHWREVVLLAGARVASTSLLALWPIADALCGAADPPEQDGGAASWGALLAAQTLWENLGGGVRQAAARNAPVRDRIRDWLLAIVTRGWLPPVDRALAGELLAALGDPRDFDEMIAIPAGEFLMGSDELDHEKPPHKVYLSAYRIGKYPVTNKQYREFVEATGREWEGLAEARRLERETCPARYITWYDAAAYCAWLTQKWRDEGKIAADEVIRLPTEAEWERAARGPLPSPLAPLPAGERGTRRWPWGDTWDETKCNTSELGLGDTTPVGIFPDGASPEGCLDLAGNVWEWTGSLWGPDWEKPKFTYPYDSEDGREDMTSRDRRVLRGSSYYNDASGARCASRIGFDLFVRGNDRGFRCVGAAGSLMS